MSFWGWVGLLVIAVIIGNAISSHAEKLKEAAKRAEDDKRRDQRIDAYTDTLARTHSDPEFARMSERERRMHVSNAADVITATRKHIDQANEGLAVLFLFGLGFFTWLGFQNTGEWSGLLPGAVISFLVCWFISHNVEKEAWTKARKDIAARSLNFDQISEVAGGAT